MTLPRRAFNGALDAATQIGRALQELGIAWIPAHSAPAKGRVERNFGTAQDRLVKGLRVAGVTTLEQANHYLAQEYLVWWEREKTREAACPDDAHRPLDRSHNLAASLSHVETRQVRPDYRSNVRRSALGDAGPTCGSSSGWTDRLAVRDQQRYLPVTECDASDRPNGASPKEKPTAPRRTGRRGSDWGKNFHLKPAPKLWQTIEASGHRPTEGS